MERRHSTTSDSSTDSRPWRDRFHPRYSLGGESVDGNGSGGSATTVPPGGRVGKTLAPKAPPNALQFVKVGPCDLYRQAQEQLKKVEEIRKAKKVQKEEVEDWQSNLDNWKCSRRKRQEHIIERVVEVKKFELEEHERNRRKSKTFSEMMQERNSRGRASNLPAYLNDEDDDFSDLGLTSNKNSSNHSNVDNASSTDGETPSAKCDEEQSRVREGEEKQEYTYEWAIQSYVNFAENRVKSKSTTCIATLSHAADKSASTGDSGAPTVPPKKYYPPVPAKPTAKVENYLKSALSEGNGTPQSDVKKPAVPKVDVNRRRELFERMQGVDESGSNTRLTPPEPSKSIKERLSSLERQAKEASLSPPKESKVNGVPIEPEVVKSRLRNIEALSTGSLSVTSPARKMKEEELLNGSLSVKERLSNLTKAVNSEPNPERRASRNNSDASRSKHSPSPTESPVNDQVDLTGSSPPPSRQHYRHRSLDSLDIDGNTGCASATTCSEDNAVSPGPFERVQSLEDLDFSSRNYPPSTFSGDTDREDSGIHTADVSSSVSQADDYELHSDPIPVVEHAETIDAHRRPHDDVSDSGETTLVEEEEEDEDEHQTDDRVVLVEGDKSASPVDNPPHPNPASTNLLPISSSCHEQTEMALQFQSSLSSVSPHISVDGETVEETSRDFRSDDETKLYSQDHSDSRDKSQSNNNNHIIENTPIPITKPTVVDETKLRFNEPTQLIKGIVMDVYSDVQQDVLFNLSPPAKLEPPKEKPPPPPTELSDEEERLSSLNESSLRRLDSTKRIKKEIRQKRSSFLGLEGNTDDSYLEPEVELVRPPDMTAILAEERRLERQLYRQSVCSESDSNQESRDSGVELDHKATDADTWGHSRNDSELFGNQNINYSDDDEIIKKEREIIETLEQEEKIRKQDLEKLALRLRELEAEKDSLEWQQIQASPPEVRARHRSAPSEPPCSAPYRQVEQTIIPKEIPLNVQPLQSAPINPKGESFWGNSSSGQNHKYDQLQYRKSLQDLSRIQSQLQPPTSQPVMTTHTHNKTVPSNALYPSSNMPHRRSMPNLQEAGVPTVTTMPPPIIAPRRPPPPPPILPERPRHNHSNGGSNLNSDANANGNGPMSRQTLQALSAVPRSRIITGDTWQAKKKQPRPNENYNYQHWLIQEAEHRRITEHHQRQMIGAPNGKPVPYEQYASPMGGPNWHNGKGVGGTVGYPHQPQKPIPPSKGKPLPDSIIQTLTQRVQKMNSDNNNRRRQEMLASQEIQKPDSMGKDKMLSVSGKKRCSHCGEELGRGAAMIIESLQLFYHIDCFKCCVCCLQLGDGLIGTDVRVRNNKLHCHNCYSSDDGVKFSCV